MRVRDGRAAKRLSKSWTLVVTTTGAAQSSMASFSLSRPAVSSEPSALGLVAWSSAEWCSSTTPSPRTSRKIAAVWSMIEVKGMA